MNKQSFIEEITTKFTDLYDYQNELDMKLLYVGMTRALHKLDIIYQNELILPLKDLDKEDKLKRKL